jgi:hypothetical protein
VAGVVETSVQGDLTTTRRAQQEPHKVPPAKAKVVETEPGVVVAGVDKMVVQEVQLLAAMTVLFQVKMATVWHPEVV